VVEFGGICGMAGIDAMKIVGGKASGTAFGRIVTMRPQIVTNRVRFREIPGFIVTIAREMRNKKPLRFPDAVLLFYSVVF